jgi:hypothetical protein
MSQVCAHRNPRITIRIDGKAYFGAGEATGFWKCGSLCAVDQTLDDAAVSDQLIRTSAPSFIKQELAGFSDDDPRVLHA